ncbi:MAG: hypothetical protein J5I47_10520, partial [Vicingus serpentipes]|nr:hypothetical protein [Vicingus serpentipes]
MKNIPLFKASIILKVCFGLLLFVGAQNILAQNTCASPVALTIGVDDSDCNSNSFGSLGQDLDNIPVAVSGSTCGVGADHAARWYSFTGNGNLIRIKLFDQTNTTRILVFENQACSGTMNAMQCGGVFPDDDLPHTVDVATTNGANYLVAILRGSGSATLSGKVCAYNTNGIPYTPVCDFGSNIAPTDITVQTADIDCFSNYTTVITSDDDANGNNGDRPGPVTGCNTNVEYWWGKFTAISTLTKFYMYGKDDANAQFIVTNGPCSGNMPNLLCQSTGSPDVPSYYELATVVGQEYYTIVRGAMDYARLCVYSEDINEPDKPFCIGGMSFEDGSGAGWNGSYGSYHLVSAPSNNWIWDNSVAGMPAAKGAVTAGAGFDPNVGGMLPVVAPGGGNNSFRIGTLGTAEGFGPVTIPGMADGNHCASVEMSFCWTVSAANAGFGYKYAVVMDYVAHEQVIQPEFEVFIEEGCGGGAIIACGDFEHFPNDGNSPFKFVGNDTDVQSETDGTIFTPWTDVATDLTGYIGQQVKVTFRVKDCEGNNSNKDGSGNWIAPYNGSHWAYAYFDTYCFPLEIEVPEFCAGASDITICAPEGFKSYSWPAGQPGLAGSPTTRCVTITNPQPGTEYTVNMMSITNCPTTTKVILNSFPVTSTGDVTMCNGAGPIDLIVTVDDPVDPPYTFNWSTGNSGVNLTTQSVNPGVTTEYWVQITNGSGCTSTDTMEVTVETCGPEVTLVGDTICEGETGTITATGSGGFLNYTFDYTGGGITGNSANGTTDPYTDSQTDNPVVTTTYTVVITDNNGDKDTAYADIVVNPLPTATATDQSFCVGGNVTLNGGGGGTYLWTPSTGLSNPNIANPVASPAATTNYQLLVTNANGCKDSITITVTVNPLPATAPATINLCDNGTGQATFDLTSVNGTVDVGGGNTVTWFSNPATTVAIGTPTAHTTGSTTVYAVIDDGTCSDTTSVYLVVDPLPVADPTTIELCDDGTGQATFDLTAVNGTVNGGTGNTVTWFSNPATTIAIGTPNAHLTGSTTVYASITDGTCTDTTSVYLVVNPLPAANDQTPAALCEDTPGSGTTTGVDLTANEAGVNGGAVTYNWFSAVPPASPIGTPTSVSVNNGDVFYVLVTDNATGCIDTAEVTYTVNPLPIITAPDATICKDDPITISGTAPGATGHVWVSLDGGLINSGGTTATPEVATNEPGAVVDVTKRFEVTVTGANGCTNKDTAEVTFEAVCGPTVNATGETICIGDTAQLTTTINNTTGTVFYAWTPTTGLDDPTIANPTVTGLGTTTIYQVIITDDLGADTATADIVINPLPVLVNQTEAFCEDTPGSGTAANKDLTIHQAAINGGAVTYSWFSDAGLTAPVPTPTNVTVSNGQIFYVLVTDNGTGCEDTATVTYTINPLPIITAPDASVCKDDPITISGTAPGAATYSWVAIDGGNINSGGTTATPEVETDQPGALVDIIRNYEVTITDGNGCSNKDTVEVTFEAICGPTVVATGDTICIGAIAQLTTVISNTTGTVFYAWTPTTGLDDPTIANPTVTGLGVTTTYQVIINDDLGADTTTANVVVNPLPAVNDQTETFCEDTQGSGTAAGKDLTTHQAAINGGAVTYSWFSDAGLTTAVPTPSNVTVSNGQIFYVLIVDNVTNCQDTATVTYTVNPLPIITAPDAIICKDLPITITANAPGATGYVWASLDGGLINSGGSTATPEVQTNEPAAVVDVIKRYEVTVTGPNGCVNKDTVEVTFEINCGPRVTLIGSTICAGETGTITATANAGDGNYTFEYTGGGITGNTGVGSPNVQNDNPVVTTTYTVIVTDGNGDKDTTTADITVNPLPVLVDQTETFCEDTQGSGTVAGKNLTIHQAAINNTPGMTFSWFSDAGLTIPVPTPTSVTVSN